MNGRGIKNCEMWVLFILMSSFFCSYHVIAYTLTIPTGIETGITPLTADSDQLEATVYNEWIIWSDNRNSFSHSWTWDLYSYNSETGNETLIRAPGDISEPSYPKIDGRRIVWQSGNTSTTYDIQIYDMMLNEYSIIAINVQGDLQPAEGPRPEISGDYIVWREKIDLDLFNIWLYQIISQTPTLIATNVSGAPLPKISENRVVWQSYNSDLGLYDVILCNISEDPVVLISGIFESPMPSIEKKTIVWQAINLTQMDAFDIFFIPDISATSNPQLAASDVALNFDPTPNPVVSNGNITWQDWRNGNLDIFLYNISRDELMQITTDSRDQRDPAISGSRIVWVDMRSGFRSDVFMYTLGAIDPCPVAAFDTNATIGGAPFPVQFTDISDPIPATWTWEFGDGNTSHDQSPVYTYLGQGTYTVNFTISTPYCRDGVSSPNLIHVGTPPEADFNATPRSGFVPLTVSFTDKSSGSATDWLWDFGDGSTSSDQNPTHIFSPGGSYNVSLTVNNTFGSNSTEKIRYISVLNRTGTVVSTVIDGLDVNGNQAATFDSSMFSNFSLTNGNTTLWFIPPPENGMSQMILFAEDGFFESGGIIIGNVTGVTFRSEDIPLAGFSPETGADCSIRYELNLSAYPINAQIASAKWEGYIPTDYDYFLQTIYHAGFAGIVGVAYEVQFQKTNLNIPANATLYLSVNSSWVATHGTRNQTWVLRIGDDMTGEVLPTTYDHSNITTNLDYFVADSPHGLSKFALTGLHGTGNPLQIIVLIVQQLFGGGSGGSDSDSCTPVCTWDKNGYSYSSCNPDDCPKSSSTGISISTGTSSLTPTPTVTTAPPSPGTKILPINPDGILNESVEVQAEDLKGTLSLFKETKAMNANGTALSYISIHRLNAEEVSSLPTAESFQGIAYELLPDGATFDTPLVFTLVIPSDIWSNSKKYSLQWYNRTSERWEAISTTGTAESHTLIAQINHFSVIGLFGYDQPITTTISETPTASPAPTSTPLSLSVSLVGIGAGVAWWIWRRR